MRLIDFRLFNADDMDRLFNATMLLRNEFEMVLGLPAQAVVTEKGHQELHRHENLGNLEILAEKDLTEDEQTEYAELAGLGSREELAGYLNEELDPSIFDQERKGQVA